jgi:YhcH/YjgK/YiaL family protein
MILDKLENSDFYNRISINLNKGFEYLKSTDLSTLKPGRHDIDGNDVFALVSEYNTKNHLECRPEAHQTYTDIQYIISGREAIGFVTLNNQVIVSEYDSEKDITFYSGDTSPLILEAGMFAVFFPQDVHCPCLQIDGPEKVKKVVVKVRKEE